MRTITKEYTIYNYNDITNNIELKNKILARYRNINTDYEWYKRLEEEWTSQLEEWGYISPDISFSGFWSQGDGASFTCNDIDIIKLVGHAGIFTKRETNILQALYNNNYIEVSVKRINHFYVHENTIRACLYTNIKSEWKRINKIIEKLTTYIETDIITISQTIYKELEKEYDYLTSDEAILETIQANNYEFYEDGSIA